LEYIFDTFTLHLFVSVHDLKVSSLSGMPEALHVPFILL
jgi:hypothetical protein